jgi:Ca2+-binding RTX toxin-like protein
VAVLALGLVMVPSIASSESVLVLHGSPGTSHPRFSVQGSALVLHKRQGIHYPGGSGCRNTHPGIRCPLGPYGRVEIDMGPSDDKVEIDSPMPVPVTVRLGAGSDKFIGNDEPDTCYSEGTKRNRCYGNGGNDVCITGNRNSDCVGGPGNDLCKHGDGSDGCWGGPGDDICLMGAGQDGCHGGLGDDRLYGGPGADQLYGGPGNDFCDGGPGRGKSHGCEHGPRH